MPTRTEKAAAKVQIKPAPSLPRLANGVKSLRQGLPEGEKSIQIGASRAENAAVPPPIRAILYEGLIERLRSSGQFECVTRAGEVSGSTANLLTLNLTIEKFTNGDPRMRALTGVALTSFKGKRL